MRLSSDLYNPHIFYEKVVFGLHLSSMFPSHLHNSKDFQNTKILSNTNSSDKPMQIRVK